MKAINKDSYFRKQSYVGESIQQTKDRLIKLRARRLDKKKKKVLQ